MRKIKSLLFISTLTFVPIFALTLTYAVNETHLDRSKVPQGCSACHKGHGKKATVMLEQSKNDLCFKCHGPTKKGIVGEAKSDIYSVILKRSRHPVIQTAQYHVPGETLPERSSGVQRHVSCYDCHNVHLSTKDKLLHSAKGYSGRGVKVRDVQREHEVCYLCHSDSANLPPNSSNIALKFDPGNASFHPVETYGKNRRVPSLKQPMSPSSKIDCTDCHGNDDRSGPKGPHGSNYPYLLKANYTRESGPESNFAYELCYDCHSRDSILNDESFSSHKRHVVHGRASCFSCHDSHGSRDTGNLIRFDSRIVFPNSKGQLVYMKAMPGKPKCFLSCHVAGSKYEHIIGDSSQQAPGDKQTAQSATRRGQYCIHTQTHTNCPPGW